MSIDPQIFEEIRKSAAAKADPLNKPESNGGKIDPKVFQNIKDNFKPVSAPEFMGMNPEEYDFQLKTSTNNNLYRAERQDWWEQAGNSLMGGMSKGLMTAVEDVGYLLDFENHAQTLTGMAHIESNWLSDWAKNNKEWLDKQMPIYKENPEKIFDWNDSASYWSALQGVVDSAIGFGVTGLGAGAVVKLASKGIGAAMKAGKTGRRIKAYTDHISKGAQALATGAITNYAEGKMMGLETYENVLEAMEGKVASGEMTHHEAEEMAGRAADEFVLRNRMFALTDAFALRGLVTGSGLTRNLLSKRNFKTIGTEMLRNAPKEALEEIGQNILQMEEMYQAKLEAGIDAKEDPNSFLLRALKYGTSDQALLEGAMGMFGGPVQYAAVQLPSNMISAKSYQEQYSRQQEILKATRDKIASVISTQQDLMTMKGQANMANLDEVTNFLEDKELLDLAAEHFMIGTFEGVEGDTKGLLNLLEDISKLTTEEAKEKGYEGNYAEAADNLVNKLRALEKTWVHTSNNPNHHEVFLNRAENDSLVKLRGTMFAKTERYKADLLARASTMNLPEGMTAQDVVDALLAEKFPKEFGFAAEKDPSAAQVKARLARTNEFKSMSSYVEAIQSVDKRLEENVKEYAEVISIDHQRKYVAKEAEDRKSEAAQVVANERKTEYDETSNTVDEKEESKPLKDEQEHSDKEEDKSKIKDEKEGLPPADVIVNKYEKDGKFNASIVFPDHDDITVSADTAEELNQKIAEEAKKFRQRENKNKSDDKGNSEKSSETINKEDQPGAAYSPEKDTAITSALKSLQQGREGQVEGNSKITDPENAAAYLSRNYEGKDGEFVEIEDFLNPNMSSVDILDPDKVNVGTEVTLKVQEDYKGDVVYKGETVSWESIKDDLTADELVNMTPIAAYLNDEVIFHLHQPDWISVKNTKGSITDARTNMHNIRAHILNQGEVKTTIKERTVGKLIVNKDQENQPVSRAISNSNIQIAVVDKGSFTREPDGSIDLPLYKGRETEDRAIEGVTYLMMPVGNGEYIPTPTRVNKIPPNIVTAIKSAADIYMRSSTGGELVPAMQDARDEILKAMGEDYDIYTPAGLRNYVQMFTYSHNGDSSVKNQKLKDFLKAQKSGYYAIDVSPTGIDFGRGAGIGFNAAAFTYTKNPDAYLSALEKHLSESYAHVHIDNLGSSTPIILMDDTYQTSQINEGGTYDDFVKEHIITTNLIDFNIGTEENPKYIYTIQPIIRYDTSFMEGVNLRIADADAESAVDKSIDDIATATAKAASLMVFDRQDAIANIQVKLTELQGYMLEVTGLDKQRDQIVALDKSLKALGGDEYKEITGDAPASIESYQEQFVQLATAAKALEESDPKRLEITKQMVTLFKEKIMPLSTSMDPGVQANTLDSLNNRVKELMEMQKKVSPSNKGKIGNTSIDLSDDEQTFFMMSKPDEEITSFLSNEYLVEGINVEEQDRIVSTIAYELNDIGYQGELETGVFSISEEQVRKFLNDTKAVFAGSDSNFATSVTEGWEKIERQVRKKLAYTFGIEEVIEDETDSVAKIDFELSSLTRGNKSNLSHLVKSRMSFIKDTKSEKIRGIPRIHDYSEVYNVIAMKLSGVRPDWAIHRQTMLAGVKQHPFLADFVKLMDESPSEVRNQFVANMTMSQLKPHAINVIDNDKEGTTFAPFDENKSSVSNRTLTNWKNNIIDSLGKNDGTIDATKQEFVTNGWSVLQKYYNDNKGKTDSYIPSLQRWLGSMGVNMSHETLMDIYHNGLDGIKFNVLMGSSSASLFNVINSKIKTMGKDQDLSISDLLTENALRRLANAEVKFSVDVPASSIKSGDKKLYIHQRNKSLTDRVNDLKRGDDYAISELTNMSKSPYYMHSFWLKNMLETDQNGFIYGEDGRVKIDKNSGAMDVLDYFDMGMDVIKEPGSFVKPMDELTDPEHEQARFAMFQNMGKLRGKTRIGKMFAPTFSDKGRTIGIDAIMMDVAMEGNSISNGTVNQIFDNVVLPEIQRMLTYKPGHNTASYAEGHNLFYSFPGLNHIDELYIGSADATVARWKDEKGDPINVDHVLKTNIMDDTAPAEVLRDIIKQHIREYLDTEISNKITEWGEMGYYDNETGELSIMDTKYKTFVKGKLKEATNENIARQAAADYISNYLVFNTNYMQFFATDPANFFKIEKSTKSRETESGKKEWSQRVYDTFTNFNKRMAGEIAPGLDFAGKDDKTYNILVVNDIVLNSESLKYKKDILGDQKGSNYANIEGTDGQEFTTIEEHMDVLVGLGRVNEKKAKEYVSRARSNSLTTEDLSMILEPMKPVYNGNIYNAGSNTYRKLYVKSSSYPLIPQLIQGTQLGRLDKLLTDAGAQRLAFSSAIKMGATENPLTVVDKKGDILENIDSAEVNKSMLKDVPRRHFRIQQEILPHEHETEVRRVSQAAKQIFSGLLNISPKFKKLQQEYYQTWGNLYKKEYDGLVKQLGINQAGRPNLEAVKELLIEEAISRGKGPAYLESLEIKDGKFMIPLWASGNSATIEPLLNSIINNRVIKQTMPGKALVLVTEEGFRSDGSQVSATAGQNVIYTDSYDGKLKPMGKKPNGSIQLNQVIVPWPFSQDINDFMKEDGTINMNMIDPAMLEIMGFRIPNQGPNSTAGAEIVGFLPPSAGNVIIAPRDFVTQMGSDFDIDKLYTYIKTGEFGTDGIFRPKVNDKNRIIDIHLEIAKDPNDEVQAMIAEPLGERKLGSMANFIEASRNKRGLGDTQISPLSEKYQRHKFLNAAKGQTAIGNFALDNVFIALAERADDQDPITYMASATKPLQMSFVGKTSNGIMSSDKTLDGKSRKIEIVSAFLSAAVDNEKLQILHKINAVPATYSAIRTMVTLGWNEEEVALLTGQDIIFDFIKAMDVHKSNRLSNAAAREAAYDDMVVKYGISSATPAKKSVSKSAMREMIQMGTKTPDYVSSQAYMLDKFLDMTDVGDKIRTAQQAVNTDTNGAGKNLWESMASEEAITSLIEGPIDNATSLIGEVYGHSEGIPPGTLGEDFFQTGRYYIIPKTINGFAATYGVFANNNMWLTEENANNAWAFPYQNPAVVNVMNQIKIISNNDGVSKNRKAEINQEIFNEMISFMASDQSVSYEGDPTAFRQQMMVNNKDNQSMVSFMASVKDNPEVNRSYVLKNLNALYASSYGDGNILTFSDLTDDALSEEKVFAELINLITNPFKMGERNGQPVYTSSFIRDQITLEYMTGRQNSYGALSRHISPKYLELMGLSDSLYRYDMAKLDDNHSFINQYYQNNPNKIGTKFQHEEMNELKNNNRVKYVENGIQAITDKNGLFDDSLLVDRGQEEPVLTEYIMVQAKYKKHVYISEGKGFYRRVPTLGSMGKKNKGLRKTISEYSPGQQVAPSLIDSNNPTWMQERLAITQPEQRPEKKGIEGKFNPDIVGSDKILSKAKLTPEESHTFIRSNLQAIVDGNNKAMSALAGVMLANPEMWKDTGIQMDPKMEQWASYNTKNHIKFGRILTDNEFSFAEVLLHEIMHRATVNGYKNNKKIAKLVDTLFNKYKEVVAADPKRAAKLIGGGRLAHSMDNAFEFMAFAMTNPGVQQLLKETPYSVDKSMWEYFLDILGEVLQSLGITENSTLYATTVGAVGAIMNKEYSVGKETELEFGFAAQPQEQSRFHALVDKKQAAINRLQKNMANLINDKMMSGNKKEVARLQNRIDKVDNNIDKVTQEIEEIVEAKQIEDLIPVVNADMSMVEALLGTDPDAKLSTKEIESISSAELLNAKRAMELWSDAMNDYFTEEERKSPILKYGTTEEEGYKQGFNYHEDRARAYLQQIFRVTQAKLAEDVGNNLSVEQTVEEMVAPRKDIGAREAQTLHIGRTDSAILQSTDKHISTANLRTSQEIREISKESKELFKQAKKKLDELGLDWNVFRQKDSSGRYTGYLASIAKGSYIKNRSRLRVAAVKDVTKWGNYSAWIRDNTIVLDPTKLDDAGYIQTMSSELGSGVVTKMVTDQKEKLKEYEEDLETKEDTIDADDLKKWVEQNSPYKYYTDHSNSTSKYLSARAERYIIDTPAIKNRDKNYEVIASDPDIKALHDYISKTFNTLSRYLPDREKSGFQGNNLLPFVRRTTTEGRGIFERLTKGVSEEIIQSLRTANMLTEDFVSEEEQGRSMNPNIISSSHRRANEILQQKMADYFVANNKQPSTKEQDEMKADSRNEALEEGTGDLQEMFNTYASAAVMYRHRAKIEDSVRMAEEVFNKIKEIDTNPAGQAKTLVGGEEMTKEGLENYKKMLRVQLDSFFLVPKKVEGRTETKLLIGEEKKTVAKMEQQIKQLEILIDQKKEEMTEMDAGAVGKQDLSNYIQSLETTHKSLSTQRDQIGGTVSGTSLGNSLLKFTQLKGMGLNIFSGFTNLGFGFLSNWIEASGNQFYTSKQLGKATGIVLRSMLRRVDNNPELAKMGSLMDRFNVLQVSSQELFKKKRSAIPGIEHAYIITEKTEYLNQAPVMAAVLLNTQVRKKNGKMGDMYDAYNPDGSISEEYDFNTVYEAEAQAKQNIDSVIMSNHGNYDPNRTQAIKDSVLGKMASQFRTWMFEGYETRFGDEKVSHDIKVDGKSLVRKGRYKSYSAGSAALAGATFGTLAFPGVGTAIGAFAGYLGGKFIGRKEENISDFEDFFYSSKQLLRKITFQGTTFDKDLSEVDASNMRRNMAELILAISAAGFGAVLKYLSKGEEDDEDLYVLNYMLNVSFRVQQDIYFYIDPGTVTSLIKNALPVMKVFTDGEEVMTAFGKYISGNDILQSGINEGDSRLKRELMQFFPATNKIVSMKSAAMQNYEDILNHATK